MTVDIDLISLAAWLHRRAVQAEAGAAYDEEYGARAALESSARLAQAARVVKEAADGQRQERAAKSRPTAANQT
jgi:hypothetical protein